MAQIRVLMILIFLLCAVLSVHAQPAARVDILIVENPFALHIYNRYQQNLSAREARLLRPYVPMVIVDEAAFLSDDFTRCMIVEIEQSTFYILKNDDQTVKNIDRAGFNKIFRRCAVLGDTVETLADRSVTLSLGDPKSTWTSPLERGAQLHRLFRYNRVDYVRTLNNPISYGWVLFPAWENGRTWKAVVRTATPGVIPLDFRQQIQSRFREVNQALKELFGYLNKETRQNRPVPQWELRVTENRITCALNDKSYVDRFSETIAYIVADLENLLLGTDFEVSYVDGVIVVQSKTR